MKINLTRRTLTALMIGGAVNLAIATGPVAKLQAAEERSYILTTATTGGTYYPVGVALATLVKVKLQPKEKISMSAINSAGSGENVKLLRENQAQFAILQGLYGRWAWTGTGKVEADGPQDHLRSITMLWQNVEHFAVLSKHVRTGTIEDLALLKGEKFSIGKRNSGTEGSGIEILSNLGIEPAGTFDVVNMGYGPSADALQNGTIEGVNMPGGAPVGAMTRAFATLGEELTVLDFTDAQIERANGGGSLWTRIVVPAGTYPGQTKAINTIAQPNFLAVRADVSEDAVYQITKTMFENLAFLQNIHKATKAMALEKALAGLPVPLHPGAARYYAEVGIEIPDYLMAQ